MGQHSNISLEMGENDKADQPNKMILDVQDRIM